MFLIANGVSGTGINIALNIVYTHLLGVAPSLVTVANDIVSGIREPEHVIILVITGILGRDPT